MELKRSSESSTGIIFHNKSIKIKGIKKQSNLNILFCRVLEVKLCSSINILFLVILSMSVKVILNKWRNGFHALLSHGIIRFWPHLSNSLFHSWLTSSHLTFHEKNIGLHGPQIYVFQIYFS